jgi:hypothetical protein
LRLILELLLFGVLVAPAQGQDRHDWKSLARLHPGDRVRLSLKTGPVNGTFQNWTPQDLTVGTVTAKREDVLKIKRYRHGSRAKRAAVGALIGFGGGFAAGVSARLYGTTRPQTGATFGGVAAALGAAIFLLIPDSREIIYSSR